MAEVDALIALACADLTISAVIHAEDRSDADKLYAVLSAIPATSPLERANYVDRIQHYLAENGHISKRSRFTWMPPKQKLIKEDNAATEFLDFDRLWSKVIALCRSNTRIPKDERLSDECRAGMLIVALAVECGALSSVEIKAALHELVATGIRVLGHLTYVNIPYRSSSTPHGTLDSRRLFLSPLAACLATSLSPKVILASAKKPDRVLKALGRAADSEVDTLNGLLNAISTGVHFTHYPPYWLLSWMKHDSIYSSCLNEGCFLRLNGYEVSSLEWEEQGPSVTQIPSRSDEDDPSLRFGDVFGAFTKILRSNISVASSLSEIESLGEQITEFSTTYPAVRQLYDWLLYLHTQLKKTSTIRLYFTAAASSVLSFCEKQDLSTLTRDDWLFVFERMVDDAVSGSRKANIATALNSLLSFLNKSYGNDIGLLPSGKGVAIANSHILSKNDLDSVCDHIRSPVSPLSVRDRDAAERLATLAWHTGMRRNELLSLRSTSIRKGHYPLIEVKDTEFFKAKSSSSVRDIPLSILDAFGTDASWLLHHDAPTWLIKPSGDIEPMEPGFEAACEKLVSGVNRSLEEVTGSRHATVHSFRHTFCNSMASHLIGPQFNFSLLSSDLPLIDQIYDDMIAYQLGHALVPPSYSEFGEMQIIRDLMGHASERTTFLHYIHIMDIFRLGMLKFQWNDEIDVLCGAAGMSIYSMQKHGSPQSILSSLLNQSAIKAIRPIKSTSVAIRPSSAVANALLRDFGIISKALSQANPPKSLLRHLSVIPDCMTTYKARSDRIAQKALSLLSTGASPNSIHDLRPTDLPERQFAARMCRNIVTWLDSIENHDQDFSLQRITDLVEDVFNAAVGHTSSAVTAQDEVFLGNLIDFTEAVIGNPEIHLRFYRRNKSAGQTASHFLDTPDVLQQFIDGQLDFTSLKVKFQFAEDHEARNDISTFSWLISMLHITLDSVKAADITSHLDNGQDI